MQTDTPETPPTPEPPRSGRRPSRRGVLMMLGTAATAAAGLTIMATTVTSAPNLPDMVSEITGAPSTQIYRDGRMLMRFDGYVSNGISAPAELEIRATNPNGAGVMATVQQRVGGVPVASPPGRTPTVVFEAADGHSHYHLKNAAEYTLWTADQTRQVALAQKTEAGFCLEDSEFRGGNRSSKYTSAPVANGGNGFCLQAPTPQPGPLVMGITPGWRDIYYAGLSYQWVDISNVAPGNYRLASRADPTDVISESDESNNGYAFRDSVVPGYTAKPVTTGRVEVGQTAAIALGADRFATNCFDGDFSDPELDTPYCNPGAVGYRITSLPTRGVIRQGATTLGVGSVLTNGAISYTASAGQRGGDSFTYEAFDTTQPNAQKSRPQAAVAVQVGAPITSIAISGAQASILAGLSMQLSAAVTNGPSGVTWSTTAGTVSQTGLFTAPATAGTATVRATSKDDPAVNAEVSVRIDPVKAQGPAPASAPIVKRFKIGRAGKRLVIAKLTAGTRTGKVRVTATFGRKVVGRCAKTVKANTTYICKIKLKRSYNLKKVRVTAKFTAGTISSTRRAFVIPAKRR